MIRGILPTNIGPFNSTSDPWMATREMCFHSICRLLRTQAVLRPAYLLKADESIILDGQASTQKPRGESLDDS
jgi:hypothetical protein